MHKNRQIIFTVKFIFNKYIYFLLNFRMQLNFNKLRKKNLYLQILWTIYKKNKITKKIYTENYQ